jgi:hypothetical protein
MEEELAKQQQTVRDLMSEKKTVSGSTSVEMWLHL